MSDEHDNVRMTITAAGKSVETTLGAVKRVAKMSTVRNAVRTVEREHKERMKAERAKAKDPVLKKLPVGFAEEAERMGEQELRDTIVQANNTKKRIQDEMEADDKLNGAKQIVKDLSEPYSDAKKAQDAKIEFCLRLLDEKGLLPDDADE